MDYLKEFCGKEVYDITDDNVPDYLVYKDVNNSGRTVVNNRACPFLGSDSLLQCKLCKDQFFVPIDMLPIL